ncbi:MAG TPA: PAS domain-containing protein, partial [Armatimonadota bacterium]
MSTPSNQHRQYGDDGSQEPVADFCQRIIGEAPIGIFQTTFAGRFLSANTAMAHMLGYSSPAELLQRVTDIAAQIFVNPEQRTALLQHVSEAHTFVREEVKYHRQDGTVLIANLYIRAIRDDTGHTAYLEGFVEDITDRTLAEQALQRSEHKYRELVESANSIILRWSREGIVTFLNEYGLRFFGFKGQEILGHSVIGTIVPETETTGRDLRTLIADILANPRGYEHNINENRRRNGERVWIDWTNKIVLDD